MLTQYANMKELLESELNVKADPVPPSKMLVTTVLRVVNELRVNARAAGPRLGKNVQFAIRASKSGCMACERRRYASC